jgi:predicted metal-dependent hydrolase
MSRLLRRLISPTPPATVQRDTVRLRLEDAEIEVLRVRDPRARRIKLSVDERGARLTLPPRASLVMGERFLEQHRDWLALQLRQYQGQGLPAPLQPGEDGVLPLRGELLPLRWQEGRARLEIDEHGACVQWPTRAGDATLRACCASSTKPDPRRRRPLAAEVPAHPARAPSRLRLKVMSSQWGSLAPDGSMALDLALVLVGRKRSSTCWCTNSAT